jgi:branched-chain amino acid transport system ATP-binding protein
MALLEVEDLHAGYGPVEVLHGISLQVDEGQTVALLGANGAGKTTTLRCIHGMLRPRGRIALDGKEICGTGTDKIVAMGVAHVPEGRGTFPTLTVEENLRLGAYARKNGNLESTTRRVFDLFPRLEERRAQQAGTLSGGEQQMLAIGRALMLNPRLMLLDEPSLGLAPVVTREMFGALRRIRDEEGLTMFVVEQNANLVLEFAHAAYVMETGTIALSGDAESVKNDENMRKAYLGY